MITEPRHDNIIVDKLIDDFQINFQQEKKHTDCEEDILSLMIAVNFNELPVASKITQQNE